jgi:hypothetical protein
MSDVIKPIGFVQATRKQAEHDYWGGEQACISLVEPFSDLKPVMQEFLPRDAVRQPAWSHELMREYWQKK